MIFALMGDRVSALKPVPSPSETLDTLNRNDKTAKALNWGCLTALYNNKFPTHLGIKLRS